MISPELGQSALGGLATSLQSGVQAQYENFANMALQDRAFAQNKEMWDAANKYNTPAAQMQRLKDAGLNPYLVYGHGSVGNTTGGYPTTQAPNFRSPDPLGDLGRFIAIEAQQATTANTIAQKETQEAIATGVKLDNVPKAYTAASLVQANQNPLGIVVPPTLSPTGRLISQVLGQSVQSTTNTAKGISNDPDWLTKARAGAQKINEDMEKYKNKKYGGH